jgi:transcriptional regulator with XRE-family HTH domain
MANFYIHKNPRDLLKELSVNARTLRKERKWSQEEMARRANMSLGSYKRFEQSGQISLESLLNIAFVFDRLNEFEGIFLPSEAKPSEKLFN